MYNEILKYIFTLTFIAGIFIKPIIAHTTVGIYIKPLGLGVALNSYIYI